MRIVFALLLFFSLFSFANCANVSLQVSSLAAQVAPNGSNYSIEVFNSSNSNEYVVVSGSEIYGVILPGFPFGEPYLSTDKQRISDALRAYYISHGYSPSALSQLSGVHEGLSQISGSHRKGEAKCRILTGTDRSPCNSYDSCQKACYSVTSFCMPIALGAGHTFINVIWQFENDSISIENAYELEGKAYSRLSGNATEWNAFLYLSSIEEINKVATRASSSRLYDDYSYCFAPDYSLGAITGLQLIAQKAYQNASKFYWLADNAGKVANRTLAGLAKKSAPLNQTVAANNTTIPAPVVPANWSQGEPKPPEGNPIPLQSEEAQNASIIFFIAIFSLSLLCGIAVVIILARRKRR